MVGTAPGVHLGRFSTDSPGCRHPSSTRNRNTRTTLVELCEQRCRSRDFTTGKGNTPDGRGRRHYNYTLKSTSVKMVCVPVCLC